jgi:hypothetical protein
MPDASRFSCCGPHGSPLGQAARDAAKSLALGKAGRHVLTVLARCADQRRTLTFVIPIEDLGDLAGIHKDTLRKFLANAGRLGLLESSTIRISDPAYGGTLARSAYKISLEKLGRRRVELAAASASGRSNADKSS